MVSSSRILSELKAWVGMALSQAGRPIVAGIGGGKLPSSSAGQRNLRVIGSLLLGTALVLGWLAVERFRAKACVSWHHCPLRTTDGGRAARRQMLPLAAFGFTKLLLDSARQFPRRRWRPLMPDTAIPGAAHIMKNPGSFLPGLSRS